MKTYSPTTIAASLFSLSYREDVNPSERLVRDVKFEIGNHTAETVRQLLENQKIEEAGQYVLNRAYQN